MDVKEKLVEFMIEVACKWGGQIGLYGYMAERLIADGWIKQEWIPASEPPKEYRDEYGELIPFLVCENGTEYPFRAMYDGKVWGDGFCAIPVTHWMPLPPQPPKEEA